MNFAYDRRPASASSSTTSFPSYYDVYPQSGPLYLQGHHARIPSDAHSDGGGSTGTGTSDGDGSHSAGASSVHLPGMYADGVRCCLPLPLLPPPG